MGLKYGHQPSIPALSGRRQDGSNFPGMMGIVVHEQDIVDGLHQFEAAIDTGILLQPGHHLIQRHLQLQAGGDGCQGVAHVILAGHLQFHLDRRRIIGYPDLEGHPHGITGQVSGLDIRLGAQAEGGHRALQFGQQGLHVGAVQASHHPAVERDGVGKLGKSLSQVLQVPVAVQMFQVDIGDDSYSGEEGEEAAIKLVRFHHDKIPPALAVIGGQAANDAADDHGGIPLGGCEHMADHGGSGGFAVRAGHCYTHVGHLKQFTQHLRPANHRNIALVGRFQFRIVQPDGGGVNHHVASIDIVTIVALEKADTELLEMIGDLSGFQIGAGNFVPQ